MQQSEHDGEKHQGVERKLQHPLQDGVPDQPCHALIIEMDLQLTQTLMFIQRRMNQQRGVGSPVRGFTEVDAQAGFGLQMQRGNVLQLHDASQLPLQRLCLDVPQCDLQQGNLRGSQVFEQLLLLIPQLTTYQKYLTDGNQQHGHNRQRAQTQQQSLAAGSISGT